VPDTTSPQPDIDPKLSSKIVDPASVVDGSSRRNHWATDTRLATLVAGFLSVVYLWRMLPGIGFTDDTSKFQFVGPTGGTVHETGYPVYLVFT